MEETIRLVFSVWNSVSGLLPGYKKQIRSFKNSLRVGLFGFIGISLVLFNPALPQEGNFSIQTASAASQGELNSAIGRLKGEMDTINAQLQQKRGEKASLQNEIAIFDGQIRQLELQIQATSLEIERTQAEIDRTNQEIVGKEKELADQKEYLKENIRVLYEEGRVSAVEMIASSDDFSEYLDKNEYLGTIQIKIRDTFEKIKNLKKELEERKNRLTTENANLTQLKQRQDGQLADLAGQRAQKDALLAQTAGQEAAYQSQLNAKADAFKAAERELQAILTRPSPAPVGNPGTGSPAGNYASVGNIKRGQVIGYQGNTGYSFGSHLHWGVYMGSMDVDPTSYVSSGRLTRPLPGAPITQGYWGTFSHRGIGWPGGWDIASYNGAPIQAAADGNIIVNSNSGPFGHHIIIDHGGGLRTLYAHMQ